MNNGNRYDVEFLSIGNYLPSKPPSRHLLVDRGKPHRGRPLHYLGNASPFLCLRNLTFKAGPHQYLGETTPFAVSQESGIQSWWGNVTLQTLFRNIASDKTDPYCYLALGRLEKSQQWFSIVRGVLMLKDDSFPEFGWFFGKTHVKQNCSTANVCDNLICPLGQLHLICCILFSEVRVSNTILFVPIAWKCVERDSCLGKR